MITKKVVYYFFLITMPTKRVSSQSSCKIAISHTLQQIKLRRRTENMYCQQDSINSFSLMSIVLAAFIQNIGHLQGDDIHSGWEQKSTWLRSLTIRMSHYLLNNSRVHKKQIQFQELLFSEKLKDMASFCVFILIPVHVTITTQGSFYYKNCCLETQLMF